MQINENGANMINPATEKYIDTRAAAKYAKLSVSTLEKLRVFGGGPRYLKLGRRVVYPMDALEEWLRAKECGSTSEYAPAA
jgi:predicted DNA-binding transcriptional regulator AlpA